MKRSMILSLVLSAALLAGCGSGKQALDSQTQTEQNVTAATETTENTETEQVVTTTAETTKAAKIYTQIDTVTYSGVPIRSTDNFNEEQKAEILEAYKALEVFFDKYLNINYPDGSQYITSVDDVRYDHNLYTHYDPEIMDFVPEKEIEFYVTCSDNEILSSSRKNEWYLVSKIDGEWTTYSEYMDN